MRHHRSSPVARSLRALVAALFLGAGLMAVPAAAPSPAAGVGPLPACRLDDILTVPRGYDDYSITLVDWILTLGKDYVPPDLVSVREGGVAGGGLIREVAIDDLRDMARAAEQNGTPLVAWSPYRGYRQQKLLFRGYVNGSGYDEAIKFSARPGHSEHQLGLTIDFVAVGDSGLTSNWEVTPTGGWMARNAWKYGWIMSYPKGKRAVTCYSYEPWHFRYVGREMAAAIHDSGLTQREYLWEHFTMVDPTTGEPIPSGSAAPSAAPSEAPSAGPSAAPPATTGPAPTGLGPSLTPTAPPASAVGTLFGIPTSVVIGLVLVLALLAAVIGLGARRSGRARRSRGR